MDFDKILKFVEDRRETVEKMEVNIFSPFKFLEREARLNEVLRFQRFLLNEKLKSLQ